MNYIEFIIFIYLITKVIYILLILITLINLYKVRLINNILILNFKIYKKIILFQFSKNYEKFILIIIFILLINKFNICLKIIK